MVSLAQGKPGTLGQCHALPRTRKMLSVWSWVEEVMEAMK